MALDELLQGLQVLHQGMQELGQQNAINDAQAKVAAIKQQGLNDQKQMQAMSGVAGELTQRLAGLGMSAAAIQAVGQSMGPTPDQLMNNDLQQKHLKQQEDLTKLHYQTQMDIARMANNTKLELKKQGLQGEFHKDIMKATTAFTEKDIKDESKKLSDLNGAAALINTAVTNGAARGFIAMDLVPVVSGLKRVNQQEFEAAGGSKALWARFSRAVEEGKTGELPITDARQLQGVLQAVGSSTRQSIQDKANHRALQFQQAYPQFSRDELYDRFLPKGSIYRDNSSGSAAPGMQVPSSPGVDNSIWSTPGFQKF
jgi:hypothetical protein